MKIVVSVLLLSLTGGVASATQAEASFCARLAPQIGLKQTGTPSIWQGRLVSGLKSALIGGSGSIAVRVEPADSSTPADMAALRDACQMAKGEFRCVVDRPLFLTVSSSKGEGQVEAQPGEKALIETKGLRVRCTDGITAPV
ncbi:hypothetical protein [Sphingomonas baiyangensis]|uniref:DUF3617 family protein n=1 Tax=Sphingomonas baiyangensis TaxID=2572576 RepID=A0A4U1L1T2_9SPHN|nr:hypothetical protein [Sphingomonas baiyangensis]TKD50817.1 hypothetical protein FBR43_08595 [Sphingomonas baiyangensis]